MTQISAQNFWNTDLEDVESVFLKKGAKITDLPTTVDDRVPAQGSVLLEKVVNVDVVVKKPSFFERVRYFLR